MNLICLYVCDPQKSLNGILAVDLPFQTLAVTIGRPDNKQNHCRTGEECECEEFHLRKGLPLVAITTMSKRNRGKPLRVSNSKLLLHLYCFKLISYWR